MTEKLTLELHNRQQANAVIKAQLLPYLVAMLQAEKRLFLTVAPRTRSLEQNARLWAMLTDISRQVDWYGRKLTPEEWKHVFTAALSKQDVVPGIDGGFVVLGKSTSRMTKGEMSELQTLMEAFGTEKGVRFAAYVDPETGEVMA
jgi:hypothetical protein